eukprot:scaffold5360_cov118-Isochrysis_galbana.AAC.7
MTCTAMYRDYGFGASSGTRKPLASKVKFFMSSRMNSPRAWTLPGLPCSLLRRKSNRATAR